MKTLNLGDICGVVTKGTTPTTLGMKLNEGNVNFIKVECLSEDGQIVWEKIQNIDETTHSKLKRSQLQVGDILFSIAGSIGRMAIVTKDLLPANTNQAVAILRPKVDLVDTDFLFYFLRDAKSQGDARKRIVQSVQNNLSLGELASLSISLPSRTTQVAISSFMRILDKKISLNRSISKTLEDLAQTIYKSWFIDFDPVKAKMAGDKPVGMDDATAALFSDSMEDSELGPIPRGWHVGAVGEICSMLVNGSTPSRSNSSFWDASEVSWFKTGELSDGFLLESKESISESALTGSSVKMLPKGSVLMAIYAAPTVGRLGILTHDSTFNQACTGMLAGKEYGLPFLFLHLKNRRNWFNSFAIGAAQQNISKSIVEKCPVVIGSEDIHEAFLAIAGPLFAEIECLTRQSEELANLRDALLPRLISGELQIPEEILVS